MIMVNPKLLGELPSETGKQVFKKNKALEKTNRTLKVSRKIN